MNITIRPATLADLEAIREIYNYYVERSTCTYQLEPETEAERLEWFRKHSPVHPVIVAELAGEVIGWASLSPWSSRCGYVRTVEGSFYVRHDLHRRGIGRSLLLELIDRARRAGHHTIICGASADQSASIALQEALGFEKAACFREVGYKFGRWLDVVYMQYFLET